MKTEINLDTWKRKSHFEFFSAMDEPFYGLTVEVDVTQAYKKAKEVQYCYADSTEQHPEKQCAFTYKELVLPPKHH